jgi:cation:H+ antiporter
VTGWPWWAAALVLLACAAVIWAAGSRLVRAADELADRTGMGQAVGGALLLGAVTSLPGVVATVTGGLAGDAAFALANPVGGVAIQTVWLAVADLVYRRVNLEHAAASLENLMQALVLVAMLALPVVAYATPDLAIGWVHPVTLLIPALYAYGFTLLRRMRRSPMWQPVRTGDTSDDEPVRPSQVPTRTLWARLGAMGLVVGAVGFVIAEAGLALIAATGMPSGVAGFTVTTAITSLPELVTVVAAVRMGAVTLAVGNIIGGNVFDTLLIAVADVAYLDGGVYQAAGPTALVLLGGTTLITAVLAAGLVMRDRRGIGFEGVSVPVLYAGTVAAALVAA